jgi:hypothetical protein
MSNRKLHLANSAENRGVVMSTDSSPDRSQESDLLEALGKSKEDISANRFVKEPASAHISRIFNLIKGPL